MYEPFGGITGDPGSVRSNVTVCSTGSRLVQRTACPTEMVTVSLPYFTAAMSTSAATVAPTAPSATGLGEPWNQGLKRFKWSGIVNSKPYRIWFEPEPSKLSKACEFPWIVFVPALLAWSENVWGDPGMRKLIAALQTARVVGLTREPMSALMAI